MNLFDIVILVVLALFVLSGIRRGMILTVCGLAASILALLGAQMAADALAPSVAQMLQPAFENSVQLRLESAWEGTALPGDAGAAAGETDLAALLGEEGLLGQMVQSDFYQHFAGTVNQTVTEGVESAVSSVAAALARSVAWLVVYGIAFLVILFLGRLATQVLNLAARLPGLRFLNQSLGGVCGLFKGIVVVVVVCSLAVGVGLIGRQSVQTSALLSFFASIRPAGL